jgi:ribA/ribD-fused uncharacterized protein
MIDDVFETDRFVFFWKGWPSQWSKSTFRVDGVTYNCCEQFMMAEKARFFHDDERLAEILRSKSPREQKALGRQVTNFDEAAWNRICRDIVFRGNLARFTQDERLAALLLATGDKTIVEASPQDCIWGIGLSADDPAAQDPSQWPGTNWLGIALMQVRETIRESRLGRQ